MKYLKIYLSCTVILLTLLFSFSLVMANEDILDQNIPESWYEKPKLASEMNIDNFNQSPILEEKVETGKLPSVKKRLPKDPPVIEPYDEIGEYGGRAHTWFSSEFNLEGGGWTFHSNAMPLKPTPSGDKQVPHMLKDWEFNDDYTVMTLHLREGLKWSDGHPFTTEDYLYWWEHIANNEDLNPTPPEDWSPGLLEVKIIDEYTVSFHYEEPVPTKFPEPWAMNTPKHYMKQYHIDFRNEDDLLKEAKEAGFDNWFEYYEYMDSISHPERGIRPTLTQYIVTNRGENYVDLIRNPYYPFVDTEGNQLPYIDKVRRNLATESEMVNTKATTGEATVAGRNLKVSNIPLYKKNEEEGNYKTLLYNAGYTSWCAIRFNLTHKEEKLREIFQNKEFRRAVSIAIDREDINDKVFYGRALPYQSTVYPTNNFFKEEYANSYIEYNPDKAKKILDDLGIEDINGDGIRELPNGEVFNPQLIYMETEGPKGKILEMVVNQLQEVGLDIDLKLLSRNLFIEREAANNFDISMWHIDGVTDIRFPYYLGMSFVPTGDWWAAQSPWPQWVHWFSSNGKTGMEPPQLIKDLNKKANILRTSIDDEKRYEAGEELVKAQAENLWTIGTVGLGFAPVIIDKNLKNVPEKGIWVYDTRFMSALYPVQFYFENE